MIYVNGTGFCDDQVLVFSTIGQGPKGDKGDKGEPGDSIAMKDINKAVSDYLDGHPEYVTRSLVVRACSSDAASLFESVFGDQANLVKPVDIADTMEIMHMLDEKSNLAWMSDNKLEIAPLRARVDVAQMAQTYPGVTLYAQGLETTVSGLTGVDSDWTITANGSGSYTDGDEVGY